MLARSAGVAQGAGPASPIPRALSCNTESAPCAAGGRSPHRRGSLDSRSPRHWRAARRCRRHGTLSGTVGEGSSRAAARREFRPRRTTVVQQTPPAAGICGSMRRRGSADEQSPVGAADAPKSSPDANLCTVRRVSSDRILAVARYRFFTAKPSLHQSRLRPGGRATRARGTSATPSSPKLTARSRTASNCTGGDRR